MAGMSNGAIVNVKLTGSHAGVSIGEDGPSQMALEDLAMMRAVPDCAVLYPCDAVSTERLVVEMAAYHGLAYMRTSRPKTDIIYGLDETVPDRRLEGPPPERERRRDGRRRRRHRASKRSRPTTS